MGCVGSCADDDVVPRVLMLGLKGAGKSTILNKLKDDDIIEVFETMGFNTETLDFDGKEVCVWDLGGDTKNRNLWRHYFNGTYGLIFVVDASDKKKFSSAKSEIEQIVSSTELLNCPVLFLMNKTDLTDLSVDEFSHEMAVLRIKQPMCQVFPVCASTGNGLSEAMSWLSKAMKKE